MKLIDRIRAAINAAIETLTRRHNSSADPAEKQVIAEAIDDLIGEIAALNQAALLEAANSIASATEVLERAVAAAKLGPFDGYLAAMESHLTQLNRLSGTAHAGDSLESAAAPASRARSSGRARAGVSASTRAGLESAAMVTSTSTKYEDLQEEYQSCFERCEMRADFSDNVAYYVKRLKQGKPNYQLAESETAVPWVFIGLIHGMECGFNFAGHLHNGDRLTARTANVPKGCPKKGEPPFTWIQSAQDALRMKKLDKVIDWSVPHMLYLLEGYNGFGYRRRGLPSPYLWSFSNIYEKGKFVADGKFDPSAVSKQCGAGLLLKAILPEV
jgi:lysozyme family protein